MKKVGLYFGTFNPIHIGHIIIANYLVEYSDLEEIWFIVTPQSPFKKKASLLPNFDRYDLVEKAIQGYEKFKVSDIEFNLPQPNYTVNTLAVLAEKNYDYDFSIIMGEDNLQHFHKWKNYEIILEYYNVYVYPRIYSGRESETQFDNHSKVHKVDAPIVEISSTFIRKAIQEEKNVSPLLQKDVLEYIEKKKFYKN